jgi:predicted dienelactone hydrolase
VVGPGRCQARSIQWQHEGMRLLGILLFLCSCGFAQQDTASYYSVPPVDAPELAVRGPWAVGVRTVELVNPKQPDILHFDKDSGKAPVYDRPLTIEIWYPATIPSGKEERVVYESAMPGAPRPGVPATFHFSGKALRDAPPVSGRTFPLVVVSHGYPGSRTFMTWLTENLASKGYVVAAIDHTDSVFGQQRAFASTLLNRAEDQMFTIDALAARSQDPGDFLHGVLDPSRVAVVGYSMGGYGALATAGAGYSRKGNAAQTVPGGYLDRWLADSKEFQSRRRDQIKAVVAIAPWGNQPPQNNWDAQGLAGIRMPSLFIAGDQDDVSGFEQGTRKAFNDAVNSERYLLVFQNARHNVGGNPPPPEALGNFLSRQFFDEPVWRKDRISAIDQHFITAFLDLYVKGDASRREYLTLPVKSPAGNQTWKGFQARWALGVEWYRYAAGQEAGAQ